MSDIIMCNEFKDRLKDGLICYIYCGFTLQELIEAMGKLGIDYISDSKRGVYQNINGVYSHVDNPLNSLILVGEGEDGESLSLEKIKNAIGTNLISHSGFEYCMNEDSRVYVAEDFSETGEPVIGICTEGIITITDILIDWHEDQNK